MWYIDKTVFYHCAVLNKTIGITTSAYDTIVIFDTNWYKKNGFEACDRTCH